MSPEAQQIAIAEAQGYVAPFTAKEHWFDNAVTDGFEVILWDAQMRSVPDYLNDLNAMHEAEKVAFREDVKTENRFVDFLLYGENGCESFYDKAQTLLYATAAQRAEAFLKTLGKWDDNL